MESVADDWPYFGAVEFESVVVRYFPDAPQVLSTVTFRVPGLKATLLVGGEGAGKTTALKALMRMQPVESGRIVVDSINVCAVGLATLRSRVAFVPQDPVLFRGTWRDNLDQAKEFSDDLL